MKTEKDKLPADLQQSISALPEAEQRELERTWALFAQLEGKRVASSDNAFIKVITALEPKKKLAQLRIWLRVAAAVALFLIGLLSGRYFLNDTNSDIADARPVYMVLLRNQDEGIVSAEERQRRVRLFSNWAKELAQSNHLKDANELRREGYLLQSNLANPVVTPLNQTEDAITGYFIIHAKDDREALDLMKSCPQFSLGGEVELRRVILH